MGNKDINSENDFGEEVGEHIPQGEFKSKFPGEKSKIATAINKALDQDHLHLDGDDSHYLRIDQAKKITSEDSIKLSKLGTQVMDFFGVDNSVLLYNEWVEGKDENFMKTFIEIIKGKGENFRVQELYFVLHTLVLRDNIQLHKNIEGTIKALWKYCATAEHETVDAQEFGEDLEKVIGDNPVQEKRKNSPNIILSAILGKLNLSNK